MFLTVSCNTLQTQSPHIHIYTHIYIHLLNITSSCIVEPYITLQLHHGGTQLLTLTPPPIPPTIPWVGVYGRRWEYIVGYSGEYIIYVVHPDGYHSPII